MLGPWQNLDLPLASIVGAVIVVAMIAIAIIGMLITSR
jgi:hypothetical protein